MKAKVVKAHGDRFKKCMDGQSFRKYLGLTVRLLVKKSKSTKSKKVQKVQKVKKYKKYKKKKSTKSKKLKKLKELTI